MKPSFLVLALFFFVVLLACSGGPSTPVAPGAPVADVAWPLRGVADPGADPAVVLLDLEGNGWCAGALLASDVVLTARRCLSILASDLECPADGAQVLGAAD